MAKRIYNQTALFGELYAYLVVISPPSDVLKRIAALKSEMNAIANIGDRNLHSIGHITLTDKLTDDDSFQDTISRLLDGSKKFTVRLSGIGHFDHKSRHTVFVKVDNPEPIIELMQLVKSPSKSPHLSLAKKIQPETLPHSNPIYERSISRPNGCAMKFWCCASSCRKRKKDFASNSASRLSKHLQTFTND